MSADAYTPERCLSVTKEAERRIHDIAALRTPSLVLNGLADRPKPGAKKAAREAFVELIAQIGALRKHIEMTRPLEFQEHDDHD